MNSIREIKLNNVRWLDIANFGQAEKDYLAQNFNFNELDLADCLSPTQRPKIEKYPGYTFLILLFPVYNRQNRQIYPSEVDFFIGKNYLITVHRNDLPPIIDLFNGCRVNEEKRKKYLADDPSALLHQIIKRFYRYCFPMLDHISLGTSRVKKNIFQGKERQMVTEILLIRQNIADFRKIMQVHKNTLHKLMGKKNGCGENNLLSQKILPHFDILVDMVKDIWDNLESFREAIETLQQTNESLISNKLNDIMKLLTIISTILLPITLIASVFGMNARHMPFIGQRYDFWVIIGIGVAVVSIMIVYFRKKRLI